MTIRKYIIDRCRLLLKAYGADALLVLNHTDADEYGLSDLGSVPVRSMAGGRPICTTEIPANKALERMLGR